MRIEPRPWYAVPNHARVIASDGSIAVRVGELLIAQDGTPSASVPPWLVFPVIVPDETDHAIMALRMAGFDVEVIG